MVTTPEVSAVRDADRIIGLLEASELREPKLIINRIRPKMVKYGDMMDIDDIIDILAVDLLGVIPEDEMVVVSTNRGELVILEQRSRSGQSYQNIVRRIVGEDIPMMDLGRGDNLVSRLKKFVGLK